MATLFSLNNSLINEKTLYQELAIGDYDRLSSKKGVDHVIQESVNLEDSENAYLPFEPIGIGKPLSIEILTIYTGDAPKKFLGGKPDLLVVSGVRKR